MPVQHQQGEAEDQHERAVEDVEAQIAALGLVELHDPGGVRRHQQVVRQECERARNQRGDQPVVDAEASAPGLADQDEPEGQHDHGEVQLDRHLRRDAVARGGAQRRSITAGRVVESPDVADHEHATGGRENHAAGETK